MLAWAGGIGKRETTDPELASAENWWEGAGHVDRRPGRPRRRARRSRNEWVWSTGQYVTRILIESRYVTRTRERRGARCTRTYVLVWRSHNPPARSARIWCHAYSKFLLDECIHIHIASDSWAWLAKSPVHLRRRVTFGIRKLAVLQSDWTAKFCSQYIQNRLDTRSSCLALVGVATPDYVRTRAG